MPRHLITKAMLALLLGAWLTAPANADVLGFRADGRSPISAARIATTSFPALRSWMNPEIADAWRQGYQGTGVTVTVIDDFTSGTRMRGDLGLGVKNQRHGEWTRQEAHMLAPSSAMRTVDFGTTQSISLTPGLNVANLSYGMVAAAGHDVRRIRWNSRESSLIGYARDGRAVIVKAAGNDAVAVGAPTRQGTQDYLNLALIGTQSGVFVGALEQNGTTDRPARLAGYSNFAGADPAVQQNFLVVGVEGHATNLYGTSFAAPVVSAYAAVLGSKFRTATPTSIANQLLSTARTDTVAGYDASIHGRGEASIARALAPVSIR